MSFRLAVLRFSAKYFGSNSVKLMFKAAKNQLEDFCRQRVKSCGPMMPTRNIKLFHAVDRSRNAILHLLQITMTGENHRSKKSDRNFNIFVVQISKTI